MSARDTHVIARLLLVAWMSGGTAAAQSTFATLSGVVLDEQRAVLAGASVTVTSLDTGGGRSASSDGNGTFRFAGLVPGRYELRLKRDGFASATPVPITLTVGEEAWIETVLRLASLKQSVTVDAARIAGTEPTRTVLGRTFSKQHRRAAGARARFQHAGRPHARRAPGSQSGRRLGAQPHRVRDRRADGS